jgi:hypothetical protein
MNYRSFKKLLHIFVIGIALLLVSTGAFGQDIQKLAGYGVDLKKTSASGLSSGAFMTSQFHVAYSSIFVGAGIIAGGPFYCVGSYSAIPAIMSFEKALDICMDPIGGLGPFPEKLVDKAKEFARQGLIDDLDNLKDDKIYIFSGANDQTVKPNVVEQTDKFYILAGVPMANIKYVKYIFAGHAILTNHQDDVPCEQTKPPFINNCDVMQSHVILRQIYGENLNPAAKILSGKLIKFDQKEFVDSRRSSMDDTAEVYVPASCEQETCKVHVVFHGCEQGAAVIGNRYYATTGYNELADTNNIIVLYPQAKPSMTIPYNPKGCWDFWGYSSPDPDNPNFYTKNAPQMSAVMKMLKRLAEPRKNN